MRAKRLVWQDNGERYAVARAGVIRFVVVKRLSGKWRAYFSADDDDYGTDDGTGVYLSGKFPTAKAAKAACQAEFDRIWREMTDTEQEPTK